MTETAELIAQLEQASDPVQTVRDMVLAEGGIWVEPTPGIPGIVEIQLAGVLGIGPSVMAALDDWLMQAKTEGKAAHLRFA
jgi:hypothetical protein